jgi:hypothetical protein
MTTISGTMHAQGKRAFEARGKTYEVRADIINFRLMCEEVIIFLAQRKAYSLLINGIDSRSTNETNRFGYHKVKEHTPSLLIFYSLSPSAPGK